MQDLAPPLRPQPRPIGLPTLQRRVLTLLSELAHDRVTLIAFVLLSGVLLAAIFATQLSPWDPARKDILARMQPPAWQEGGNVSHLLGTDHLGRDILGRLIFGARASLIAGLLVVTIAGTIGTLVGMASGYFGGRVDDVLMRLVDLQAAFPGLLLALAILAVVGPSLGTVVAVLCFNGWMVYARIARGQVMALRQQQFVEAAIALGCSPWRVIFVHALPNVASTLVTLGALELANVILAEASLSFLGMGVQPPETSWGLMVSEGQQYVTAAWWLVTLPGLAILLTVLAINLLASWLRSNTDPVLRLRKGAGVL